MLDPFVGTPAPFGLGLPPSTFGLGWARCLLRVWLDFPPHFEVLHLPLPFSLSGTSTVCHLCRLETPLPPSQSTQGMAGLPTFPCVLRAECESLRRLACLGCNGGVWGSRRRRTRRSRPPHKLIRGFHGLENRLPFMACACQASGDGLEVSRFPDVELRARLDERLTP